MLKESDWRSIKRVLGGTELLYIRLTDDEVERIYRARERAYRLEDAENALLDTWGDGRENDISPETDLAFFEEWGFYLRAAIDEVSNDYILEDIVEQFETLLDCNTPENSTWENACQKALEEAKSLQSYQ